MEKEKKALAPPSLETWKSRGAYHQIGQHKIFVIDEGQHEETIAILHGYPSGSYDYYQTLPIWTQRYRLVVHDHLGLGLSDKPQDYSYSLIEQADIALALWQRLGIKAVHLLAHDYGTSVATEIIARAEQGYEPVRLQSITLGNGSMLIEMSQLLITQKILKHDFWGPILASLTNNAIFINSFRKLWADKSKIDYEEFAVLWEMLIYNDGRKVLPRVTKYIEERKKYWHRWIGALSRTSRLVNLIWADKDPVAIVEMVYELEKKITNTNVQILPSVGHYPMLEAPEKYAEAVTQAIATAKDSLPEQIEAENPKVSIHMVASLDGFIAKKDNSISWLTPFDHYEAGVKLTDETIEAFLERVDCYVMGANTYEHALKLGWPYGDKPVFVLSHRNLSSDREQVKFYKGDLEAFVNNQLKPAFKNIWVAGGAMLVKDFIRLKLADEIIMSIIPIILGEGILFFDYIGQEQGLHLKDVKAYKDGMVELWYEVPKG